MIKRVTVWLMAVLGMLLADDIVWQQDLQSAMALAKQEHRALMVMVEGKHCRWCKKMRYRTLADEAVVKKLKPFVSVRVDKEDSQNMQLLPPIKGVPTIFFLTPEGKTIATSVGYYTVSDFISYISSIEQNSTKTQ